MKRLQIGLLILLPYGAHCADSYIGKGETTIVKICDADYDPDTTYTWSVSKGSTIVKLTGSDNCFRTVEGLETGDATIDISGCGSFDITVVEVHFGSLGRDVDGASFPEGVAPGKTNRIAATINPTLDAGVEVDLVIEGSGGAASIEKPGSKTLTGDGGGIAVKGDTVTPAGSGGGLKIVAKIGGNKVGESAPFSVYALPCDWSETETNNIGSYAKYLIVSWYSDTGSNPDLAEVEFRERISVANRDNPPFAGYLGPGLPAIPMHFGYVTDEFSVPSNTVKNLTAGNLTINQIYEIRDNRSGSGWVVFYPETIVWEVYDNDTSSAADWKLNLRRDSDYSSVNHVWDL